MSITSHHRLPGPRPAATVAPPSGDELRQAAYQEFLYGAGVVPGLDLGRPVRYSKEGGVFRQQFERGLALANTGDAPVEVVLDRAYDDADGTRRTRVTLPARSAEVLRAAH